MSASSENKRRLPPAALCVTDGNLKDGSRLVDDVNAGRYYETTIAHPALFFVARNLDRERLKRFPPELQRELQPMAEAVARARAEQIASYQKNGPYVRVVWLEKASHYLFIDRAREVASRMLAFLEETSR